MDPQNVLNSWLFIEMIQPAELPKSNIIPGYLFSDGKQRQQINKMNFLQEFIKTAKPKNPRTYTTQYTYYMNCYKLSDLIDTFRSFFKHDDDVINKPTQRCYSFSFQVNDTNEYIEDSLFIPHVHTVIYDMLHTDKINYSHFIDRYNDARYQLEEDAKTLFSNGVTSEAVQKLSKNFYRYFDEPTHDHLHFFEMHIVRKNADKKKPSFNSFYIEDLQTIKRKGMNETLHQFIKGKDLQVDIEQDHQAIESLLSPKNLPDGRWPSRIDHRLSLMQQVAVNQIIHGDGPVYSVNGPPGTGKTTLLQDIFAHFIVERAKQMVTYQDPTDAFKIIGKYQANPFEYKRNMYELDENIAKYTMVIASSNNGAVENISKELPEITKISRDLEEEGDDKETALESKKRLYINEIEELFTREIKDIDLFSEVASELLSGKKAWGLFSIALGKKGNINAVSEIINRSDYNKSYNKPKYLLDLLSESLHKNSWEEAVKEFQSQLHETTLLKEKLQKLKDDHEQYGYINEEELNASYERLIEKRKHLRKEFQQLQTEKELLNEYISIKTPKGFLQKVKTVLRGERNNELTTLKENLSQIIARQKEIVNEKHILKTEIEKLNTKRTKLRHFLQTKRQFVDEELIIPDKNYWNEEQNDFRQQNVPWQTHSLNVARSMLFLKALKVHKIFLMKNHKAIKNAIYLFSNLKSINVNISEQKTYLNQMWKTMHLLFPVQSTTFASIGSMYGGIDQDFIDYLFIDEAGQASPQEAAGALWRSKKAIVVGDPNQIEPVVTLDDTILEDIKQTFQVSDRYVGSSASVQVLADYANPIGTYIKQEKARIGIPLWVHRRCLNPMFSIANELAYDGKMVLAKHGQGKSHWYDCTGKAIDNQYVKEQGEFLVKKIKEHFKKHDKDNSLPSVFIITPFTAVRKNLIKLIENRLQESYPQIKKWASQSIGTVHTFQGKEADIVYFVTGTDEETDSAANWSCRQPNLLNVAVTRAKKEFYIIGDEKRFREKKFYHIIYKHSTKESP